MARQHHQQQHISGSAREGNRFVIDSPVRRTLAGPSMEGVPTGQLVLSKLHIPVVRANLVPRERLFALLDEAVARKLTVVTAPAGFGKTTLLASWAERLPRRVAHPVAWLSLEEAENDPARFWEYTVAALRSVLPSLGTQMRGLLSGPRPLGVDAAMPTLVAELQTAADAAPSDVILVLDDYHLITAEATRAGMAFLLEHLPSRIHLLIASRSQVPLPLARTRARGELAELDSTALAFTPDEAAHFLHEITGLCVCDATAAEICARAEGWVAGLQLAALALHGRRELPNALPAVTGSHRFVADYFRDEVLARQPEDIQRFLLATSVLERFSAELCAYVTGDPHAAKHLEQLERNNLFLIALDEQRQWYRYHQLFADMLRAQLQRTTPTEMHALYHRSAEWHERNGQFEEAIGYALRADDAEWASSLIERAALDALGHGHVITVHGWITALPPKLIRARAGLSLLAGWVMLLFDEWECVEPHLQRAEALLEESQGADASATASPAFASPDDMRGFAATARAALAQQRRDPAGVIRHGEAALDLLAVDNWQMRGQAAGYLGSAHVMRGDIEQAQRWLEESIGMNERGGNLYPARSAQCVLAMVLFEHGKLHAARRACEPVVDIPALPGKHIAVRVLAAVYREWDDLETAARYLEDVIREAMAAGDAGSDAYARDLLSLALVYRAAGRSAEALHAIEQAERLAREERVSRTVAQRAAVARALASLAWGDLAAASAWAETCGLHADDASSPVRETDYLIYARILLAEGDAAASLKIAQRVRQASEAQRRTGTVVEALAIEALALSALGRSDESLAALERALGLAEPEGIVGVFADEGRPMASLLKQVRAAGCRPGRPLRVSTDYLERTLAATHRRMRAHQIASPHASPHASPRMPSPPLPEPLSERELEVLLHVATGSSNQEIASALVVAVSTVKTHLNNIYGKLGVRSRTQALARAQSLGLL